MKRWRKLCLAGSWAIVSGMTVLALAVFRFHPIQALFSLGPLIFIAALSTIRARKIDP